MGNLLVIGTVIILLTMTLLAPFQIDITTKKDNILNGIEEGVYSVEDLICTDSSVKLFYKDDEGNINYIVIEYSDYAELLEKEIID